MPWIPRKSTRPSRRASAVARAFALAVMLAPLAGCSSLTALFGEPADKLYNEGLYLLNDRKEYKSAAKKFEEVDRQHPYSDWARKSLIMSAYAHYESREYDESVSAARRFITLHPG